MFAAEYGMAADLMAKPATLLWQTGLRQEYASSVSAQTK